MELAKITAKGQITLPIALRRKLNLKEGGKVAFIDRQGGYFLVNPLMLAIADAQKAFEGEAERLGLQSEDDVVALVKDVRREMWEEQDADRA
ncbi:MAG: AbrB/MazE/SpoVT family DNA-binding domain-containing protein [Oscillospiraceae bacterium]|nr:AbrB/MazE/SpoVT family DNA-binding domain-containing protein [Oscillospiraceae bacterium]